MKKHSNLFWAGARLPRKALIVLMAFALMGCAAGRAYREGNALLDEGNLEQGLAKLEEAMKLEPDNADYRIAYNSKRTVIINKLISGAEAATRSGYTGDAERNYRRVLLIDPDNAMARQGRYQLALTARHNEYLNEADALIQNGTPADLNAALEKLQPILDQNPAHKEALALRGRANAALKNLRPENKLSDTFRKPISLEFRDAPLKSVLNVIAQSTGLNFFYDKDVAQDLRVTVFAKKTTTEDALRLILATNQLEQKILNGNSILIYPSTPQKLRDYQTLATRTFYLTNGDVKSVTNALKTIVRARDLVYDERLGIIFMRDTPEAIRMAERIVALQDLNDPEVMLEVEIMEVKRSRLLNLGIQWPTSLSLTPLALTSLPAATGAVNTATTLSDLSKLSASSTQATLGSTIINANKEEQNGTMLANPRIRVRNKEKAKVQIGDRVPVITATSASGVVTESVNYIDVGLKLEVEPTIYLDDQVAIKVNLEVSSIVREILSKSGTLSYQIGTRGANTVLRLKDGETQILAGLINDEDRTTANKVPGLGDLPFTSRLFGNQKDTSDRTEILLSITPRVVRTIRPPDITMTEFESGTETSMGSQTLQLSTVLTTEPPGTGEVK